MSRSRTARYEARELALAAPASNIQFHASSTESDARSVKIVYNRVEHGSTRIKSCRDRVELLSSF